MSYLNQISDKELKKGIKDFLETAPDLYMPAITVDSVIFGFHNDKLKVLLLRFSNTPFFVLPGGYIMKDENLDDAALRILQERTELQNIYLEQFYTSGNSKRSKDVFAKEIIQELIGSIPNSSWFDQRFISVCYYALVDDTKVNPQPQVFFTESKWFDVSKLPKLLYDHNLIIKKALGRLKSDLDEKLVGFNLMSETFTMGQLQKLYEAVHQKKFVRTNFQRKMLSLNVLERLEKQYSGKSHKAPYLYRFIKSK
ncbi:MAG: NUDIX domain-containing protein [Bacteroidota bacterium]